LDIGWDQEVIQGIFSVFVYLQKTYSFLKKRLCLNKILLNKVHIRKLNSSICEEKNENLHVTASTSQWSEILRLSPEKRTSVKSLCFVANLKILKGEIGIFLLDKKNNNPLSTEIILRNGETKSISLPYSNNLNEKTCIGIRNVSCVNKTEFIIEKPIFEEVRTLDLANEKKDVILLGLKQPLKAAQYCREVLYSDKPKELRDKLPVNLKYTRQSYVIPKAEKTWTSHHEKIIYQTSKDLINLLPTYISAEMGSNNVHLDRDFFEKYLYMNVVRIANLHEILVRSYDFNKGTLLEVGSYFGSFALALQRLGYQVTAVDRYSNYGEALECYTELMKKEGVKVISTSRENEWEKIEKLPQYQAVISMAVIEHIPHTPRLFLEGLKKKVEKGGVLAIDTPNLVRYWARKDFAEGKPNMMSIKDQFMCDIPFEGHHREYTRNEVEWMFNQLNLEKITTTMFDYNQFQFNEIYKNQIDCIVKFIEDESYADTILALGIVK